MHLLDAVDIATPVVAAGSSAGSPRDYHTPRSRGHSNSSLAVMPGSAVGGQTTTVPMACGNATSRPARIVANDPVPEMRVRCAGP